MTFVLKQQRFHHHHVKTQNPRNHLTCLINSIAPHWHLAAFTTDSPSESSSDIGLIIGIVVGLLVLLIIGAVVGYYIYKKKKNQIYDREKKENANYRKFISLFIKMTKYLNCISFKPFHIFHHFLAESPKIVYPIIGSCIYFHIVQTYIIPWISLFLYFCFF